MIENRTLGDRLVQSLFYLILALAALLCLLPLVHVFAVSLSDRSASSGNLVTLWPIGFTLASYRQIMASTQFVRAIWVSVQRAVLGTAINVVMIVLTAYPLSRTPKEFKGRNIFMWFVLFAMLFSPGLIPWYLNIRDLGLLDSLWALVLPGMLPIWSVILTMNFFREIPKELDDAALIDGATHWDLFLRIYLPMSIPVLATVTLFAVVGHWNAWFDGMILINKIDLVPLQTYMRRVVILGNLRAFMESVVYDSMDFMNFSDRSLKAAQIFVATLPILVVYPFLQRYFIHGIRLGAVKG
jgi:ABC-type glycerol-3-phosphate transport system permease component